MKKKIGIAFLIVLVLSGIVIADKWIKNSASHTQKEDFTDKDSLELDSTDENSMKQNSSNEAIGEKKSVAEGTSFFYEKSLYTFLSNNRLELTECYAEPDISSVSVPELVPYEGDNYPVTKIGNNAFHSYCANVSQIEFPKTITDVGYQAFRGTEWLNSIQMTDYVIIGDDTLAYFHVKESTVTIPDGVKHIGAAFFKNPDITSISIPKSVESISEKAFYYCTSLSEVEVPDTVDYIDIDAFTGTPWLAGQEDFVITGNQILLAYHGKTENVVLPEKIRLIAPGAFANSMVKEITFPATIQKIGREAFSGCLNLEKIILPDSVQVIENKAFVMCSALKEISISAEIQYMGPNTFLYCDKLEYPEIPEEITKKFSKQYLGLIQQ